MISLNCVLDHFKSKFPSCEGAVADAWNPSTSQAEAGGSWGAQADPYLKNKRQKKKSEKKANLPNCKTNQQSDT